MVGAPLLAGRAALRIGAGLVTIASTADVTDKLEKRVEEIMTLAISANSTEALAKLRDSINERKVNAVVVGPGLSPDKSELVRQLVKSIELPMIIDGGGLSALKEVKTLQSKGRTLRDVVLTPHAGEFKRLIGRDLPKDENELKKLAKNFAKRNSIILVLKGHPTYVTTGAGDLYENRTGGPGLATAGTGDVLAGMIAGLIAQEIEPAEAAKAGVYIHGLAGDLAVKQKTQAGLIASDVIEFIPSALKTLE